MAIAALNVWTGGPLLALWIGSRAQGEGPPTMTAIFVVVVALSVISLISLRLLGYLNRLHEKMTGQTATVRQHTPWLRSMRGERPQYGGVEPTLTALERILVVMVVAAFVAFEVWFFFFSSSPIDNRTGRSAMPVSGHHLAHTGGLRAKAPGYVERRNQDGYRLGAMKNL
jgi:hypothetical protein